MNKLSKHFVVRPSSVWIVIGVSFFVIGWWLCIFTTGYFGARKIADKFTAIRQFRQDLTPNHANTRLVFCQDTEQGVGIYFCDVGDGQSRLLCEKKENPLQWRRFSMLGWSPDDRLFACALPDPKQDKESILIFDGASSEPTAHLEVDQGLSQFVWLTPAAFAYATRTDVRVVINRGHSWEHKRFFEKVATDLENFTAISDHSVAWREGGDIWLLDTDSASPPEKIWEATTNTLVEFTYAKSSGDFLLNCSDENGQYLLLYNPQQKRTTDAGRIGPYRDYIRNAVWTGRETAYVFLTNKLGGTEFCIKTDEGLQVNSFPWDGGVSSASAGSFILNGRQLFFNGNANGQPPGVWDLDLDTRTFKQIFPPSGSVKNETQPPLTCDALTNSLGDVRFYHLWTPSHLVPNKKYPLLIAQEHNDWFPYFQIAADCGYYVAVVDRPFAHTWNGAQQKTWAEDVQSLYDRLARQPDIDTNNVYFFAYSAETYYLSDLLNNHPELWKGAVLFSPVALPNAAKLPGKKIMAIAGNGDSETVSHLAEYQNQAAAFGTPVTVYILGNAGHIPESGVSERKRARQFAGFLSANH